MFKLFAVLAAVAVLNLSAAAEDKFVKIVHSSGKVLAIENNSEENEAKAVLAKDDGSEGQQWKIEKDGEHLKLVNRKSGKVLDVNNESTEEGGDIIQWEDKTDGNDNQRWSWVGDGQSRRLKSKSSQLVLDVGEGDAIVQKKADDKAKSQLWELAEVKKK